MLARGTINSKSRLGVESSKSRMCMLGLINDKEVTVARHWDVRTDPPLDHDKDFDLE